MSTAIHDALVKQLSDYMSGMSIHEARALAHSLTVSVSTYVAKISSGSSKDKVDCLPIFPKEVWTELSVGVPWEAFSHAYGVYAGRTHSQHVEAVCSGPHYLDSAMASHPRMSGLWGGSLLVAIGKLLHEVDREVLLFSPYWRKEGCRALLAAASRESYAGVAVNIFTQPVRRMRNGDFEGLSYFVSMLKAMNATVRIATPRAFDGLTPMLHSKLIVADEVKAYVGSANFTKSGLDHGFEAGVLVIGPVAAAFAAWARAIGRVCEIESSL